MSLGRVVLAPPERRELERRARSRLLAVELVKRAKVILMLAAGRSYGEISERLGCTDRYISLWKKRFKQERLTGLNSRYRGAEHRRRTAQIEARILELTRRGPTDGSTHWSSWTVPQSAGTCCSILCRREECYPSLGSLGHGFAPFSRPGRTAWLRILSPWNAFSLRRAEHSKWRGVG